MYQPANATLLVRGDLLHQVISEQYPLKESLRAPTDVLNVVCLAADLTKEVVNR